MCVFIDSLGKQWLFVICILCDRSTVAYHSTLHMFYEDTPEVSLCEKKEDGYTRYERTFIIILLFYTFQIDLTRNNRTDRLKMTNLKTKKEKTTLYKLFTSRFLLDPFWGSSIYYIKVEILFICLSVRHHFLFFSFSFRI